MSGRSLSHATFVVERRYDAPPAAVFAAFADPAAKRRWFAEGDGWEVEAFEADFRVGGWERSRFRFRGGPLIRNDTVYLDIVPDARIVIAYGMAVGEAPISSSLATIELRPEGAGTRLTFTEQDAFLDGQDNAGQREQGTRGLLDALDAELARTRAGA